MLGSRPNITMTSQKSHRYGQPRENCRLAVLNRFSFSRSKRGVGESVSRTVPFSRYVGLGAPDSKSRQKAGQMYSASPAMVESANCAYFSGHNEA